MLRAGPLGLAVLALLFFGGGPAPVAGRPPERSERVVSYSMQVELRPELKQVHGRLDLVWRNTSAEPVDHLYFHLYLNAFRDENSTYLREGRRGGKRGARWSSEHPGWIRINSMRPEGGEELWTDATRRFESPDDGNPDDRTLARVQLPAAVAPGETIGLAIDFDSQLPRVLHRTGWAGDPDDPDSLFFMVAQWFPKVAVLRSGPEGQPRWNAHQFHKNTEFFSDYGVYQVEITVPRRYVVGATGRRVGLTDHGETITYVHRQEDVHDFAWTASPHFREESFRWSFDRFLEEEPALGERLRALLSRTAQHLGRPPDEVKPARDVDVHLLLQPDQGALAARFRRAVGASLACYQIWFGDYPYDVLTVVAPPAGGGAAGGMEYPTLITVWGDGTAPSWSTGMEGVTIHEFGHQYFYGLLGSNEFEEAWLDEGFTSFTDARTFEETYGPTIATTRYPPFHTPRYRPFEPPGIFARLKRLLRLDAWIGKIPPPWDEPDELLPVPGPNGFWQYLRDLPFLHFDAHVPVTQPYGERAGVLAHSSHDAMVLPGWHFASRRDYRVNSYGKPTVFLYCLRGLMGEERFDRALRAYAERFRFRHPTTEDFLAVLAEHTPEEQRAVVDGFVEAMLESADRLDVAVLDASQRELPDGRWAWTVRVQRRGGVPVPLDVVVEREDGGRETLATWWSHGRETTRTFRAVRDGRFRAVRIGPDWIRFVDGFLADNARRVDGADGRPAAALACRWSLFAEEVLRTYAGLAR